MINPLITQTRELMVFCGAGISFDSGLPLALDLTRHLLRQLPLDAAQRSRVVRSHLPFEAIMESISSHSDITRLMDIYRLGTPNLNHIIIARLARKGMITKIVTTNFDLLLEKALIQEGLKEGVDFHVAITQDHFEEFLREGQRHNVLIVKLHGSADNYESIRTTLRAVAAHSLASRTAKVIESLLSHGSHDVVVFLGYSFSDAFDISPAIQSVRPKSKRILLVRHSSNRASVKPLSVLPVDHPLHGFAGDRISCNTRRFISQIGRLRNVLATGGDTGGRSLDWTSAVERWQSTVAAYRKLFIASSLLEKSGDLESAVNLIRAAMPVTKKDGDRRTLQYCYSALGDILQEMSQVREAIDWSRKALRLARRHGDPQLIAGALRGLASGYFRLGEYEKARGYYEDSLQRSRASGDRRSIAASSSNVGWVYSILGENETALRRFRTARRIHSNLGNKRGEASSHLGSGNCYHRMGRFQEAKRHYATALEIGVLLRDISTQSAAQWGLASALHHIGEYQESLKQTKLALRAAAKVGKDTSGIFIVLGATQNRLGLYDQALRSFRTAIRLDTAIGDVNGRASGYVGIGEVYLNKRLYGYARRHFLKALKLCRGKDNPEVKMKANEGLASVHESLGNGRMSMVYRSIAFKVAWRIGDKDSIARIKRDLATL